jgi:hypothetical protein
VPTIRRKSHSAGFLLGTKTLSPHLTLPHLTHFMCSTPVNCQIVKQSCHISYSTDSKTDLQASNWSSSIPPSSSRSRSRSPSLDRWIKTDVAPIDSAHTSLTDHSPTQLGTQLLAAPAGRSPGSHSSETSLEITQVRFSSLPQVSPATSCSTLPTAEARGRIRGR